MCLTVTLSDWLLTSHFCAEFCSASNSAVMALRDYQHTTCHSSYAVAVSTKLHRSSEFCWKTSGRRQLYATSPPLTNVALNRSKTVETVITHGKRKHFACQPPSLPNISHAFTIKMFGVTWLSRTNCLSLTRSPRQQQMVCTYYTCSWTVWCNCPDALPCPVMPCNLPNRSVVIARCLQQGCRNGFL